MFHINNNLTNETKQLSFTLGLTPSSKTKKPKNITVEEIKTKLSKFINITEIAKIDQSFEITCFNKLKEFDYFKKIFNLTIWHDYCISIRIKNKTEVGKPECASNLNENKEAKRFKESFKKDIKKLDKKKESTPIDDSKKSNKKNKSKLIDDSAKAEKKKESNSTNVSKKSNKENESKPIDDSAKSYKENEINAIDDSKIQKAPENETSPQTPISEEETNKQAESFIKKESTENELEQTKEEDCNKRETQNDNNKMLEKKKHKSLRKNILIDECLHSIFKEDKGQSQFRILKESQPEENKQVFKTTKFNRKVNMPLSKIANNTNEVKIKNFFN